MKATTTNKPTQTGNRLFFVSGLLKGHEAQRMVKSYLSQEETKSITIKELGGISLCRS